MGAVMKHRKATGSGYTFSLSVVAVIFSSTVDIKTEPLCRKKTHAYILNDDDKWSEVLCFKFGGI